MQWIIFLDFGHVPVLSNGGPKTMVLAPMADSVNFTEAALNLLWLS